MREAPPTVDHYATLGVTPRSEDVVIRAAYLALMRRYHPDKDSAPVSGERARAVIAAFSVLGDSETRIKYDWDQRRLAEQLARPRPLLTRARVAIAAALMVILVVPLLFFQFPRQTAAPTPPQSARPGTPPSLEPPPQGRQFKVARTEPVEAPLAAVAPPRPAPPPASIDQPAVGEVAAPPDRKLAQATPLDVRPAPARPAPIERRQARARVAVTKPPPAAKPLLANDENLAALDRLAMTYYGQSLKVDNLAKRAALVESRGGLLTRRDACRSDSCLKGAYLAHMREISAIVEGRQPAPQ